MNSNFLLSDEIEITKNDLNIRKELYEAFSEMPEDFFSRMRHFQPQIGCFNNCSFCSKSSIYGSEYWAESSLRNVISALKEASREVTNDDILLAYRRNEHRIGVVFPYLNNDIGSYEYLDKYIELSYKELGIRTRISTVGYSRHNEHLNNVHRYISKNLLPSLAGVRLSVTEYGKVFEDKSSAYSLEELKLDWANFLSIYKPYYEKYGSGSRNMCAELRFKPLVVNSSVFTFKYKSHFVIAFNNYLYISKDKKIYFNTSYINNALIHSIDLTEKPIIFKYYDLDFNISNVEQVIDYLNKLDDNYKEVEVYQMKNNDGIYYAIDPKLTSTGNYGINVFPLEGSRQKSGYIISERFLLNAIAKLKAKYNKKLNEEYVNSTWIDVKEVIEICKTDAQNYLVNSKLEKADYIIKNVIPLVSTYIESLKLAGYTSDSFFDKHFTIDTGIICNMGRAIYEFKGLTDFLNEPLTPTHERNYGRHHSTMKIENSVWRLSCGFNNTLLIEKLELFNTASVRGQVSFHKVIQLDNFNTKITEEEKKNINILPGEKIK